GSPFPPVALTRSEARNAWALTQEYRVTGSEKDLGTPYAVTFVIPKDFEFDLASIPRVFWWLIAPFELSLVAPLVHDFIYTTDGRMPTGSAQKDGKDVTTLDRKAADDLFLAFMRAEGVSRWRRSLAYWAVRLFGGLFWTDREAGNMPHAKVP